ncbi:MAG: sulfite exporter TauE/SafE family protein [Deltaproteobacteria bacterium]
METYTIIIFLVTGLGGGLLGGLLGIGGGMVLMPVMQFVLGYPPQVAVGTTMLAVVFTAASGTWQHWKLGNVDWKMVIWIAPAGVLGVLAGSALFHFIKSDTGLVNLILGIILLLASCQMVYEGVRRNGPEPVCREMGGGHGTRLGLGAGAGILAGISGLGGGAILLPGFTFLCGASMRLAIGTSMASFLWYALAGAGLKIFDGVTDIPAGLIMGIATAVGAIGGARIVPHVPGALLKLLFGVVFIYISIKYIVSYFGMTI